jgi:hypothetical protein
MGAVWARLSGLGYHEDTKATKGHEGFTRRNLT